MKPYLALAFLSLLAISPAKAITPEVVDIGGVEATRIVIAPPETSLASAIKEGLRTAYEARRPGTRAYDNALGLYYFYGARHFEPIWLNEDPSGKVTLSDKANDVLAVYRKSYLSGLRPDDYLTPQIAIDPSAATPADLARFETVFSATALKYAQDIYGGRVDPSSVSPMITIKPHRLDEAETLKKLIEARDPAAFLETLEPRQREYLGLKSALAKFYDGTVHETVSIPDGPTLRPGRTDPRLPLLRMRLNVAESGAGNAYDPATVSAVEDFQASLGLVVDGIVGPATIAALNGGSATSKADIVANMERWRWMPSDMGDFYVQVNIPEFRLAVMDHGRVAFTTRVVTGKKTNQTPIFSDEIEHIVVNPYWNVPASIAEKEIAPALASNPGYFARNNMELLYGGKIVDAAAVDWSSTSIDNFRIRQRPGAGNALGSVKFLFPNQHDVYLHDTPSKSLFARSFRAFSHGCVRVQNPWDFAAALLAHEHKITLASLESEIGNSERWNNLGTHVPVHLTYFTLRVDPDGTIRSYGDVYGHNARLIRLLGE